MKKVDEYKSLLKDLLAGHESLKKKVSSMQRELDIKRKQIEDCQTEISKLENSVRVVVSDHAVVRYLERNKGIDIEELKKEILTEKVVNFIHYFKGTGTFPGGNNMSYIVKDYVITTIVNKNGEKVRS